MASFLYSFSFSQSQYVQEFVIFFTIKLLFAIHFLMRIFSFVLEYLDVQYLSSLITTSVGQLLDRPPKLNRHGLVLEAAIEAAAHAVINIKDSLNEWDAKAGDGDCGSTVSLLVCHSLDELMKRSPFFSCSYKSLHCYEIFYVTILPWFCRCLKVQLRFLRT